jgi:hypothetical protein
LGCHFSGGIASFLVLVEGESYDNLVDKQASLSDAKLVEPGDPDASVLYNRVADTGVFGGRMPQPPSAPLAPEDVELIRLWILEGALEN